jgi:N-methylhydantoinase A
LALRVGVDIGGTFTDLVFLNEETGEIASTKALTTPDQLTSAVLSCLELARVDLAKARFVIHGTTVGINAVIERKGARTALLTTNGFRDVLEIGRGDFKRMYDLLYQRPVILVPRHLRFEIPERMAADGEELIPLDESEIRDAAERLKKENVESVAVVYLFSYIDASHERRTAEILAETCPNLSISVSHRISQEWREYERTSTTVVNAYIQPTMEHYLGDFLSSLRARQFDGRLLVTQSNGGAFSVEAALAQPVHTLESGPAAGAVGCAALSRLKGEEKIISFDMGGTTAKCCIIDRGFAQVAEEYDVDGHPIRIPVVDIKEVSAGGGSIGWIDAGGALTLGPQSAGAKPGPACYGLGGSEPTVTDANLVVGRINPTAFLGGRMALDFDAAAGAIEEKVARPLNMDRLAAATGILRLADVKMALALRSITTERGLDPREHTLVAYGGCGPLHAGSIARELSIRKIWIPPAPSTFSAWGMLAADLRHDLVRTVLKPLEVTDATWASERYGEMAKEIGKLLPTSGSLKLRNAVDLRYLGQIHTVTIEVHDLQAWSVVRAEFDRAHEKAYGYSAADVEVELLNLRLTAIIPIEPPKLSKVKSSSKTSLPVAHRKIYSSATRQMLESGVFLRDALAAGDRVVGPAAIEEASTTTILDVGDVLTVDEHGFLVIEVGR